MNRIRSSYDSYVYWHLLTRTLKLCLLIIYVDAISGCAIDLPQLRMTSSRPIQEQMAWSTLWGQRHFPCWPLEMSFVTWTLESDATVLVNYALTMMATVEFNLLSGECLWFLCKLLLYKCVLIDRWWYDGWWHYWMFRAGSSFLGAGVPGREVWPTLGSGWEPLSSVYCIERRGVWDPRASCVHHW